MKPDGYRRVRPERVDPFRRKPWQRGCTRKEDQGRTFRLETRAGEFTVAASLRVQTRKRRETKKHAASLDWQGAESERARSHSCNTRSRAI